MLGLYFSARDLLGLYFSARGFCCCNEKVMQFNERCSLVVVVEYRIACLKTT